ncbi:MAG: response regulator, partial [Trueperella sp.]|nr:response regulator [Trueperella sp.]
MVAQRGNSKPEAKILVVDDEPTIRELLSASLRFAGFDVATAQDGAEAIRVERDFQADLVVLDIMLPDMDGFEVLVELREREPDLPVLFLTAKDDVQDRVRGLEVGADDYVTKPFSLEEVVARIHAILRRTSPD